MNAVARAQLTYQMLTLTKIPEANTESMFLTPTNDTEIQRVLTRMKISAPGHDEMSAKVIKPVIDSLSSPSTYIINLSFNEGIFRSELKLHKSSLYIKMMIPCSLTITDQCHFSLSTCLLSIRISLACARASKLTTTNTYIARSRCESQLAVRSSGLNDC